MPDAETTLRENYNLARFDPTDRGGFYESFFQRANHPTRPLAFWNRYTVFAPKGRPEDAIGELWSIYFDGESGRHTALKRELPIRECEFARDRFFARVGDAVLEPGKLTGALTQSDGPGDGASTATKSIAWKLDYAGDAEPLFNLPAKFYAGGFPKAKVLVGLPLARFHGELEVNGTSVEIKDWIGSQNHNWGVRHTDRYAWGQVAGFDGAAASFLELATAQIKIGPLWTPALTPIVLRHGGREFRLNALFSSFGRAQYRQPRANQAGNATVARDAHWEFRARSPEIEIEGTIKACPGDFVCLPYYNPPGGVKFCLNSKIAACRLELKIANGPAAVLETAHRAAFEILTDDPQGLAPAFAYSAI